MSRLILALIVAFCNCQIIKSNSDLTVHTERGAVIGKYVETLSGKKFAAFTGIPYAKPPIGELRFQPPIPIENWNGTIEATSDKSMCLQAEAVFGGDGGVVGEEDCLYLNVYAPADLKNNVKTAVMVWFHGGGFKIGSGNMAMYGPQILMEHDIVLVSMNYRLGPLGFLSTGDKVVPGNNGLKDQLLALKWCKDNIHFFGGDPDKITIFGESSGSASTHLHMLSPLSKGLFRSVISQSGSALADWAVHTPKEALALTTKLATSCKCPTDSHNGMVECLKKLPANEIIKNQKNLWEVIEPIIMFRPVVEEKHEGAFLEDFPGNIMRSGKQLEVPWMVGFTKDEGSIIAAALFSSPKEMDLLDANFDKLFLQTAVSSNKKLSQATQQIKKFYFGDEHIKANKQGLIDLYSDAMFTYSIDEMVRLGRQKSTTNVYYYVFSFQGSRSTCSLTGDKNDKNDYGVCHGEDLLYLFKTPFADGDGDDNDAKVSKILTSMWIHFAKYLDPTQPTVENGLGITWKPITTDNNEYLSIRGPDDLQMRDNVYKKRLDFWRSLNLESKTYTRDE